MKPSILLIDDNRAVLKVLQSFFQRNDFHVHAALSAKEAWKKLEQESVDIIISDVMMPEMDGFQLAQKLQDHPKFSNIPIIYLTALDSLEDEFQGYLSGAVGYIAKPFNTNDLLKKVLRVLQYNEEEQPLVARRGFAFDVARVLVLQEEKETQEVSSYLQAEGYEVENANPEPSLLSLLDKKVYHLLLADLRTQHSKLIGKEIVDFLISFKLKIPVLFFIDHEQPLASEVESYAHTLLTPPFDLKEMGISCRRALKKYRPSKKLF